MIFQERQRYIFCTFFTSDMATESRKRTLAEIQDDQEEEMNKKLDENPTVGDLVTNGLTRLTALLHQFITILGLGKCRLFKH